MTKQRLVPLMVFIASSLMLWETWQSDHAPPQPAMSATAAPLAGQTSSLPQPVSQDSGTVPPAPAAQTPESAELRHGTSVKVQTDLVEADIDTAGGDIRSLRLLKQLDADDKPVQLLEDKGALIHVVQSGLLGTGLPNHTSPFVPDVPQASLAPGQDNLDISLRATIPGVAEVVKTYHFSRNSYLVTMDTTVRNLGSTPISPEAYYQFLRSSQVPTGDPRFVSTYTGPAVYTNDTKFQKVAFKDIDKGKQDYPVTANNGWIAMLQHYFVAAWLPQQGMKREFFTRKVGNDLYTAGVILPMQAIAPGASVTQAVPLYLGPQEGTKLKSLAPGLDLTIDYGRLTLIAVPLFSVLSWIHGWVGNWGVAIILLTVLIKAIFFPLSAASYKSMAKMRLLQPKLTKIKEQYGDDKARYNQAMMELYKNEKVNPLGGCLPMIVQIPVFISLYWVLLGAVELRHAPFFGWIHDLSAQDPYYILPVLMTASMILQQRMSPKPADPVQAKVMMAMPLAFSVMFLFFPSGLVLYWVVNNLLSIAQQWQITRMIGDGKR